MGLNITKKENFDLLASAVKEKNNITNDLNFNGVVSEISNIENLEEKIMDKTIITYSNNKVKKIRDNAFRNCTSLQSIDVSLCEYIGNYAFCICTKLQSIDLPACSYIGDYAFWDCHSLQSIDLPMCSYIGNSAFCDCLLQSIDLPMCNYVDSCAFDYCSSLQSVNLPMCEHLGGWAFANCSSLQSIGLPMCKYLKSSVFSNCTSLTNLTLGYSSVAILSRNAFANTPMSISTLTGSFGSIYVPASLVASYKSATNWVTYSDRITAIPQ